MMVLGLLQRRLGPSNGFWARVLVRHLGRLAVGCRSWVLGEQDVAWESRLRRSVRRSLFGHVEELVQLDCWLRVRSESSVRIELVLVEVVGDI